MLWPVLSVVTAGFGRISHGCQLDEGSAHPCIVLGRDRGDRHYILFVLGWLGLITLPTGAIALVVFSVVVLILKAKQKRAA